MESHLDINTFSNIFIAASTLPISIHTMYYCICRLYPCTPCCPKKRTYHALLLMNCTHLGSATASSEKLITGPGQNYSRYFMVVQFLMLNNLLFFVYCFDCLFIKKIKVSHKTQNTIKIYYWKNYQRCTSKNNNNNDNNNNQQY